MQLGYVHAHRVLKANHAVKYVKPMVCVMYPQAAQSYPVLLIYYVILSLR
jgi:hypothetical protein